MTEQPEFSSQGQITVRIDHSAVELQERERADKAEKALAEAENEIENLKAKTPKPTGTVPLNENQSQSSHNESGKSNYPAFQDIPSMMRYVVKNANSDPYLQSVYDQAFRRAITEPSNECWTLDSTLSELINGKGRWKLGKNQNRAEIIERI